jgi:hypothetical protein
VAGRREDFGSLAEVIAEWSDDSRGALDLRKIEDMYSYAPKERLRDTRMGSASPFWEIILHATLLLESDYILEGFRQYLHSLDLQVNLDDRLHAQGLCFLSVRIPRELIGKVSGFSILRLEREMPKMRPVIRAGKSVPSFKVTFPDADVLNPTIRVVAFDYGLPETPNISRWSTRKRAKGVGKSHPQLLEHGLGVTSALLFGPLSDGEPLPTPFAKVDHIRVLDDTSADDDTQEYFDVNKRVISSLESGRYDFANFSIGPDLPIEDDDVHVWTAMLDQFLNRATFLASIAVGNTGEMVHATGNTRIQSPSDCVNGLAFGSADCLGDAWKRSVHSSVGPGRSSGVVKPDLLSFGGSPKTPFYVIGMSGQAEGRIGTSFASPAGLRAAIGVRTYLGPIMSPLAIKALLINRCSVSELPQTEVGWGKIAESFGDLITCEDSDAHIVYQGEIAPGSWIRAPIPVPDEEMEGMVDIRATFCFASATDPQDPVNYTRSGLEVRYRPHNGKRKDDEQKDVDTKPFFSVSKLYATEAELRSDAAKWETTLHARKRFRGSSLKNPVFDIHYNAREGGGKTNNAQNIPYALIVSVRAPKVADLYDRIVRRYRTILEALKPVVDIQIRK